MSSDTSAGDDPLGSLADEAAKLFGALTQNLRAHGDPVAPECEWCPLCRGVRALWDLSPEVREHLTAAGESIIRAASEMLATHVERPGRQ